MATPASGQISFSQIAQIVYNNASATVSFNDTDVRKLLNTTTDLSTISFSVAYSKPVANSYSYTSAGDYTLLILPYQNIDVDARGGGQGGNGGTGSDTCTGWCGQLCFFNYCCNGRGGAAGDSGGDSYFRGDGKDITAYAGTSSGAGGGYGGSVTTGGGGAGGTLGYGFGCTGSNGSAGNPGGRVTKTYTKGSDGPGYTTSIAIRVGGGGAGGYNAGGTGGSGAVYVSIR